VASYTDNFDRTNGAPGANWTAINSGTWAISSNTLRQSDVTGTYRAIRWNGGAFDSANFYARVTAQAPSGMGFGVMVRCPTTGTAATDIDGYAIMGYTGDQWYRIEFTNGSDAGYVGLGGTCAANTNYTIEARADGSTITIYLNSSQLASWTDATYTTGGAMLLSYGGTIIYDNFEAADLAASTTYPVAAWIRRRTAMLIDSWRMSTWADFTASISRRSRPAPRKTSLSLSHPATPRRVFVCTPSA